MFWPIKNGTTEIVYKFYECNIPPVGYGCHNETGAIKKIDILKRSTKEKDQFWESIKLPANWAKNEKIEVLKQIENPDYFDPVLEKFREADWNRRLYGVWFYNNGKPIYITGEHYMYLNWWNLDGGLPNYRDPDRKRYYVQQYCIQDERCAGMIEASNRRSGKSYRGALFLYEFTSRTTDANAGAQSKTDVDIKNLFKGKVVTPFRRLPSHHRPEIDTTTGINPEKELKFTKTSKRGKRAMESIDEMGLNSFINYLSSEQYAYDGWKLHRYLGDEVGKTIGVNVYDRWRVVKYCLRVGKKWIGKALLTTTVERLKGEVSQTDAFKQLWYESNPNERDANGHTTSGLYKYFTPAYEMFEFDKYGNPLIEEGRDFYLNTRLGLSHDPHALASEISKNPFTEEELFYVDGERCLYDAMKLNIQLDAISTKQNLYERGNFVWENGEPFTKVNWERANNGRFYARLLFPADGGSNKVLNNGRNFAPNNNHIFTIGCDPFKYDKTKDNRRSDCAAYVFKKFDVGEMTNPFNESFVCEYHYRAPTTAMQYDDVLKMAWYYGCQILFERNVNNWLDQFVNWKCQGFLMKLPGEDEFGIYNDGQGKVKQQIADYTESYINEHVGQVVYAGLIKEWLEFKIDETTKFDRAMAAGFALIAARRKTYRQVAQEGAREVTEYFKMYKAV
jgi:hypothetical protein